MKTVKRNILLTIVFILVTLVNYANDGTISNTIKKVKIVFENVEKGNLLIIKDQYGIVLHEEKISKDGNLTKFLDFSSLKEGIYTIEVDKSYEILIKKIEVKNNQIFLDKNAVKIIAKTIIGNNKNLVLVSKINLDKSPLNVKVYCNDIVMIEETIISEEDLIEKMYKLDETKKGNYKVVVSNNNRTTVKKFSL